MADLERGNRPKTLDLGPDSEGASYDGQDKTAEKGELETPATGWSSNVPDGGLAAWLVVLGGWCTSFCSFGWINSIGTFQEYYQRGPLSNYSSSTIAWIPSLQVFFMMAMGPIVGKLYDRFGPRYLILGGTFLHVFGLMMASISTQYYQFLLAQGVCSAIGVAAIFQPTLSAIATWFNKKRGVANGVLASGSSIGGVVFPIMVSRLITSVGYSWAMRASAFLILAMLIIANLTIRAHGSNSPRPSVKPDMAKPFKEPGFVLLMAGMFLLTFGIYVPINYLPLQAIQGGMRPDLAQYLVSILNAASLFGRLTSGIVADKVGRYNTFVVSCYTTGIFVLALWIPAKSDNAIIAFSVLFGFFSGAYVSLINTLVAQISPLPEIGFRTGLIFLVAALPGLVTSPIAGAIYAESGGWIATRVFSGVFCLAGTTVILAARIRFTGWKLSAVF